MGMRYLAINRTGVYRKQTLNGREHYVVPMALISPGVLNGSKGALYYPPEEISRNYDAWNGMPLVVYHPVSGGKPVSARTPEVLEKQGVGSVLNARINQNGKLVAEGWFDVEKTKAIDARIISSIERGETIELSTGLFTDNIPVKNGESLKYNGKQYTHVAKNYRPDHLAVLPDQVGACSIKDGCGVGVLNAASLAKQGKTRKVCKDCGKSNCECETTTENLLSHSEMYPIIEKALRERYSGAYVNELYPDFVVFRWADNLYQLDYEFDRKTDDLILSPEMPSPVRRVISYKPLTTLNELAETILNAHTGKVRRKRKLAKLQNVVTSGDPTSFDYKEVSAVDVINSYFKTCKRDKRGKCLPKGSSGEKGSDAKSAKTAKASAKSVSTKAGKGKTPKKVKSIAGEPVTPPSEMKVTIKGLNPTKGKPAKTARVGVAGEEVPPPPKMAMLPNLTKSERKVEREFTKAYEKDPDGMANKLRKLIKKTTKPGDPPTFGTDDAKVLHKAWGNKNLTLDQRAVNRATLNTPLHQTANAVTKRAFVQHLNTMKKGEEILVTVGGCGAGKGYALKNVPDALEMKKRSKAVWDSAGDQNATENAWIQKEAEKRGLKVNYVFVDADPKTQWAHPERGVVKRAQDPNDGRMVDAKVFADSYALGAKNHQAFYESNKKNPNANFIFLENGSNPRQIPGIPKKRLKQDAKKLADYAIEVIAKTPDLPPHVRRGATVGTRIWPEGLTANEATLNADEEETFDQEFDDSEEYYDGLERINDMTDLSEESDFQVETEHEPMELDENGVEITEDEEDEDEEEESENGEEPTKNSLLDHPGLSNNVKTLLILNAWSKEAIEASAEARKKGKEVVGAVKAAGKATGKALGQAGKSLAQSMLQKLKDKLGIKSKPAEKAKPKMEKDKSAEKKSAKDRAKARSEARKKRLDAYKASKGGRKTKIAQSKQVRSKVREVNARKRANETAKKRTQAADKRSQKKGFKNADDERRFNDASRRTAARQRKEAAHEKGIARKKASQSSSTKGRSAVASSKDSVRKSLRG